MEEREAIARLKRGDISGLEALVRRYQLPAVRASYLVTREPALAEDVVQSAFLRAFERIEQFDAGRPFGPWFLRSVVNAAKTAARQVRPVSLDALEEQARGPGGGPPPGGLTDRGPSPEAAIERAETTEAVRVVLDRLSPVQRAVIVQRYYLEWSEAEMAAALACPPGTIKRRLHAARQRLRTLLWPLKAGAEASEPEGSPAK